MGKLVSYLILSVFLISLVSGSLTIRYDEKTKGVVMDSSNYTTYQNITNINITGTNITLNTTQFFNVSNDYNINESWLELFINGLGIASDNATWNETYAYTLFYAIDNPLAFINQTQADLLYYNISNPLAFINSTQVPTYETDPIYSANTYAVGMDQDVSSVGTPSFEFITLWSLSAGGLAVIEAGTGTVGVVSNESFLSTYNLTYDTTTNEWNGNESSLARVGNCLDGEVVMNTTTGGVECVPLVADSTTYYPNQTLVTGGTNATDNITEMWYYDGYFYNVSEGTGANPMDVYINYSNVSNFGQIVLREYYSGSANHYIQVQLWDNVNSVWENYFEFVGQTGQTIISVPVFDDTNHIGTDEKVQLRLHHVETGVSAHRLYIDFAWLVDGMNIGASTNLDGYARYNFNFNNFTGNGTYFSTGNITTTKYFIGNGSQLTDIAGTNASWNESRASLLFYAIDNPLAFLNQTTGADYFYPRDTNPNAFINDTTWQYNQTQPAIDFILTNPLAWINTTNENATILDQPVNTTSNVLFNRVNVTTNLTVEGWILLNVTASERGIYDNGTCIIVVGATGTLNTC